ncbi:MAG: flagellar type III secretion system protein FlhB [Parvularculaceae bacterium]
MSGEDDNQGADKSFEPTQGRLDRARKDGDVAQSKEANAAAAYVGLLIALSIVGADLAAKLAEIFTAAWDHPDGLARAVFFSADARLELMVAVLKYTAPIFAAPALCVLASLAVQRALVFAPSKVKPKFSRLSAVKNFKQKFGPDGFGEFVKSAVKLVIVMAIFAAFAASKADDVFAYALMPAMAGATQISRTAVALLGVIALFSIVIAGLDLPWTFSRHKKRLMMSFEEVKREHKESEGDPALKHNRRARAQAIATNRMLLDVPDANVVIVNPEHYAVALRWDGPKTGAPVCCAKGVDALAAKIREIAAESGVPIRSDPPTARAIYAVVKVGEEVRREHYAAVAAAIHFAENIRQRARAT